MNETGADSSLKEAQPDANLDLKAGNGKFT